MMLPVALLLGKINALSSHITAQLIKLLRLSSFYLCVRALLSMTIGPRDQLCSQTNFCLCCWTVPRVVVVIVCAHLCVSLYALQILLCQTFCAADTVNHWSIRADTQTSLMCVHQTSPPGEINKFPPRRWEISSDHLSYEKSWRIDQVSEMFCWGFFSFVWDRINWEHTSVTFKGSSHFVHSRWRMKGSCLRRVSPPEGRSQEQTLLLIPNREELSVLVWMFEMFGINWSNNICLSFYLCIVSADRCLAAFLCFKCL